MHRYTGKFSPSLSLARARARAQIHSYVDRVQYRSRFSSVKRKPRSRVLIIITAAFGAAKIIRRFRILISNFGWN